jgi:hypothetical protein
MFLAQCFLVWDCFGVQMIDIHIRLSAALRAMTSPETERAVMMLVVFIQLVKLGGAINYSDFSGLRFPFSLLLDLQPAFDLRRIDRSLSQ